MTDLFEAALAAAAAMIPIATEQKKAAAMIPIATEQKKPSQCPADSKKPAFDAPIAKPISPK